MTLKNKYQAQRQLGSWPKLLHTKTSRAGCMERRAGNMRMEKAGFAGNPAHRTAESALEQVACHPLPKQGGR